MQKPCLNADLAKHLGHTSIIWLIERKRRNHWYMWKPPKPYLLPQLYALIPLMKERPGWTLKLQKGRKLGCFASAFHEPSSPDILWRNLFPSFFTGMFSFSFQKHSQRTDSKLGFRQFFAFRPAYSFYPTSLFYSYSKNLLRFIAKQFGSEWIWAINFHCFPGYLLTWHASGKHKMLICKLHSTTNNTISKIRSEY